MEFFNDLDTLLKLYWYITIPSSVIFVIQTILTFVGADADAGNNADFDGNFDGTDAPFQLFSFRNLINFLLGFGWTGVSFYGLISSSFLLITLSLLVGVLFVWLFFIIIQQVQKLSEDNSFDIQNTIGLTAEVYLTIPAQKTGKGKVMVSVKGAYHELEASSNDENPIPSHTLVKIIALEGKNLLIVEKL